MNARKTSDQILRECLQECVHLKSAMIDEEEEQQEDYIFSDEFEAGMKKLLVVRKKKTEWTKGFKYAVAMAATMLVVVGIISASATSTKATLPSIDILDWLDDHFEFNKGMADSKDGELIFDEAQITYIPEGFIKTGENKNFTYVEYKYENAVGTHFSIYVSKAEVTPQQDNEEITREIFLNEDGYECLFIERKNELAYSWEDSKGLFYNVYGNVDKNELNSVMNGIQYKGENK